MVKFYGRMEMQSIACVEFKWLNLGRLTNYNIDLFSPWTYCLGWRVLQYNFELILVYEIE